MKILVVGSGAREHALCWSIAKHGNRKIWCAPGNPGTAQVATNVPIAASDIIALVKFATANEINLVVPGSEVSLCGGITDAMLKVDVPCCGPTWQASQLESSKAFTKVLCKAAGIPTAEWGAFQDVKSAETYIKKVGTPLVIKADGLAAGKGVVMADTEQKAIHAVRDVLERRVFGNAGSVVVVEEQLAGQEVSFFVLCNGTKAVPLGAAQDHKRLNASPTALNTGGMGAYTQPSIFTQDMQDQTMEQIILPTLHSMIKRERPFQGILFAGLMINDGPKLIEYNVRLGDPEWQALAMCLETDPLDLFMGVLAGRIPLPQMRPETGISVVMAAPGYPEAPERGSEIKSVTVPPNAQVFHAGTETTPGGRLIAAGGRVLTVCSTGLDLAEARRNVYAAIDSIDWPQGYYRNDIGALG